MRVVHITALFENSHMNFEFERKDPNHEVAGEPSLEEMTEKAIKILSKNPNGFFLLVEGRFNHIMSLQLNLNTSSTDDSGN